MGMDLAVVSRDWLPGSGENASILGRVRVKAMSTGFVQSMMGMMDMDNDDGENAHSYSGRSRSRPSPRYTSTYSMYTSYA